MGTSRRTGRSSESTFGAQIDLFPLDNDEPIDAPRTHPTPFASSTSSPPKPPPPPSPRRDPYEENREYEANAALCWAIVRRRDQHPAEDPPFHTCGMGLSVAYPDPPVIVFFDRRVPYRAVLDAILRTAPLHRSISDAFAARVLDDMFRRASPRAFNRFEALARAALDDAPAAPTPLSPDRIKALALSALADNDTKRP